MKRCYSLKRNKQFRYVYRVGKSVSDRYIVLIYAPKSKSKDAKNKNNDNEYNIHIGLTVSKKIGNSVVRNKVKRRLREVIRPFLPKIKNGYNIIVIARTSIVDAEFKNISLCFARSLNKAGLLKQPEV